MTSSEMMLPSILSSLHDERRCLTVKSIMLEHSLSRIDALSLLEQCLLENGTTAGNKDDEKECTYEVTRRVVAKENGITVVRLVRSTVVAPPAPTAKKAKGTIYSVALLPPDGSAPPNLRSAIEQATAVLGDMALDTENESRSNEAFDPSLRCGCVRPSVGTEGKYTVDQDLGTIRRTDAESRRVRRIAASLGVGGAKLSNKVVTKTTKMSSSTRKATTAASFFGSSSSSSAAAKKKTANAKASGTSSKNATSSSKATGSKKAAEKKKVGKDKKAKITVIDSDDDEEAEFCDDDEEVAAAKSKAVQEEKENVANRTAKSSSSFKKSGSKVTKKADKSTKSARGNVDDFVGDEDEDDDFVREEEERKKRNAVSARREVREVAANEERARHVKAALKTRRKAAPKSKGGDDSDEEEDEVRDMDVDDEEQEFEDKVTGAMDAFAQKKKPRADDGGDNSGTGGRKRRKKLVEKTTMDEHGYLHTETVTVWEDVPSDEESPQKGLAPQKKSNTGSMAKASATKKAGGAKAKPKQKKQAGLMGFFAKKK